MKNGEYWRGRALILAASAEKSGAAYARSAGVEFDKASRRIQEDILSWYQRFAKNNKISLTEAKRLLNSGELKELKWSVQDYIKAGESLDPKWAKALENASAKFHISRLEALQLQVQQEIELLYGNHVDELDSLLRGIYSEGYYHTAFELQKGFNVGWDLQSLNEKQLKTVLSTPWTTDNQTFRDRCWKNKTALVSEVKTSMTQAMIRGDHPTKAAEAIAKRFDVSKAKAARLTMTESAYFSAVSQQDCYSDLGVERFVIVETLDSHTCATCAGMDGEVLPMKDYEPGVTAPPFHPWCRGCTAPYFDDMDGERFARDKDGEAYYVPASMKYPEWKKTFVDGGSKEGLTPTVRTGIIKNIEIPSEITVIESMSKETVEEIRSAIEKLNDEYDAHLDDVRVCDFGIQDSRTPFRYLAENAGGFLNSVLEINSGYDFNGSLSAFTDRIGRNNSRGVLAARSVEDLIAHEFAHAMTFQDCENYSVFTRVEEEVRDLYEKGVSLYADESYDGAECIAEAFVRDRNGEPISKGMKAAIEKYIERWRK